MLDADECRQEVKRCVTLAAETTDPILKERLAETAQGWASLAADYETLWMELARSNNCGG